MTTNEAARATRDVEVSEWFNRSVAVVRTDRTTGRIANAASRAGGDAMDVAIRETPAAVAGGVAWCLDSLRGALLAAGRGA